MKHIAWVFNGFQTYSDRCGFGTKTVRGGQEALGRERAKIFNLRRNLVSAKERPCAVPPVTRQQCSIHCEISRMAHGASKRRWVPANHQRCSERSEKAGITKTELKLGHMPTADCTGSTVVGICFSFEALGSGVSYEFSILHPHFNSCLSIQGCHQALKQQTWNKTRPDCADNAANREPCFDRIIRKSAKAVRFTEVSWSSGSRMTGRLWRSSLKSLL